jgi:hypothetical protein
MNTIQRKDIKGDSIKSLPSVYRGITFRSRLEARWAAYFDLLQIQWIYEPEGFELPSGNYCPDFEIKSFYFKSNYLEVKPNKESADFIAHKLVDLVKMTKRDVFCVIGNPHERIDARLYHINSEESEVDFCPGVFSWYAWVRKKWDTLFLCGEFSDGGDETCLQIIAGMRFENGVCHEDYRTLAKSIKP